MLCLYASTKPRYYITKTRFYDDIIVIYELEVNGGVGSLHIAIEGILSSELSSRGHLKTVVMRCHRIAQCQIIGPNL